jgi:hypothetical protein
MFLTQKRSAQIVFSARCAVKPDVVSAGKANIKYHLPGWVRHLPMENIWHGKRKRERA